LSRSPGKRARPVLRGRGRSNASSLPDWRPFFYLLEARGLRCWLVNARDVKNVPGRPKTDRLDAIWLAKLAERGMLRASFVPPEPVRQLRDLTRLRTVLTEDRTRYRSRIEKVLEDAQIKVSSVVSDLFGVSGRAFLAALVAGERSPGALAELARGRLRGKHAALIEALTGRFLEHHAYLIGLLLEDHDRLTAQIDQLTTRIEAAIHEIDPTPPPDDDHPERPGLLARLSEIPGVGPGSAAVIIAAPSSPARRARTGPPGRATGGSRGTWPRRRSRPHGPRPSSERATGASPNTPRRRKPSSRSPETSSRSPGS
jgi:transposase